MQLTLTTPAVLFSAISLLMLAYTNRFLAYATLVRGLHDKYLEQKQKRILYQIKNLRLRLRLIRSMQIAGISSLLLCVVTMFLVYIQVLRIAEFVFGVALVLLMVSLGILIWEIQISVNALDAQIDDLKE
ncbi:MAG: DUF2721 domain-containing protein [Deltaproteobacteria bacterium]|nr:DUF2721 domain-containing protein [Deltaproteobacteria bacterium]